jgi:hypothetical protein
MRPPEAEPATEAQAHGPPPATIIRLNSATSQDAYHDIVATASRLMGWSGVLLLRQRIGWPGRR